MNMMRNAIKVNLSNVVPRETEFVDAFEVAKIYDIDGLINGFAHTVISLQILQVFCPLKKNSLSSEWSPEPYMIQSGHC